jgi:hypothetical protein
MDFSLTVSPGNNTNKFIVHLVEKGTTGIFEEKSVDDGVRR